MTRKEEAIFNNKLVELLTGEGENDIGDKEFFERLLYANNCIARCLFEFKDIYDEVNTNVKEDITTEKETPVPPYYVASVSVGNTCASLGFFSTMEKAQASIIDYENALNSSKTYYNWDEFMNGYGDNEIKITDYDISSTYLDTN